MYMYLQDMKFLWAMLSLGQLYTDDDTNDDDDDDNDTLTMMTMTHDGQIMIA